MKISEVIDEINDQFKNDTFQIIKGHTFSKMPPLPFCTYAIKDVKETIPIKDLSRTQINNVITKRADIYKQYKLQFKIFSKYMYEADDYLTRLESVLLITLRDKLNRSGVGIYEYTDNGQSTEKQANKTYLQTRSAFVTLDSTKSIESEDPDLEKVSIFGDINLHEDF